MKRTSIIQRLCLFLLLMASATGAWAEYSLLFNSTDQGKNATVTTLTKSPVTITFDNCKTSGAGNIYELAKGTGLTISVTSSFRIREIVLEDTEGGNDYNNGGLDRIGAYSDASYSMAFVKNSGSQPDNNNIQFRNYDAPAQSFRIVGHNTSKGQLKIRRITVIYVKACTAAFAQSSMTAYAMGADFTPDLNTNGHYGSPTYKSDNTSVATISVSRVVTPQYIGTTTLRAAFPATFDYAKGECTATIVVNRDPVTFSFKSTPAKVLFSKGSSAGRVIYNFYGNVDVNTGSGQGFQSTNTEFSIASSNTSVISEPNRTTGTLTFGGTTGTATVTMNQAENNRYAAASLSHTFTVVRTDEDGTVLIGDLNEWKMFASLVNDEGMTTLNAKLDADIDLGTLNNSEILKLKLGIETSKAYSGTLDGNGHLIALDWSGGNAGALIGTVRDATVRNLRVRSKLSASVEMSGLIGRVVGDCNISNCLVDVDFTTQQETSAASGGLIGAVNYDGNATISNCVVSGKFTGTTANQRRGWCGFVSGVYGTCTLTNCFYIGTNEATDWSYTFAKGATLNNCYYLNACGEAQGTQVTEDQLKSGEVAHLLQGDRSEQIWGQTIGTDTVPQLTADATRHVYKVTFTKDEQPVATRYVNTGKAINGSLPTVQEILGDSYDAHHYYTLAFADDFNTSTAVTADKTVAVTLTDNEYYEIATKEDWKAFCDLVNGGQTTVDAKLTKNINLGNNIWQVGSSDHKYSGMFDGDGYSITVDWNSTTCNLALFYQINGATIHNLHTRGSITTTHYYGALSGMVWQADGNVALSSCSSMVNLTLAGTGNYRSAGLIGSLSGGASATLTDCIVGGQFSGVEENARNNWSGFVFSSFDASSTLTNCLYIGNNNGYKWCRTFVYGENISLNNCYYLNACGYYEVQGTQITEEQLKSGYVLGKLGAAWAQTLGEMPGLYNEADKGKDNYVYYDAANSKWVCGCYKFSENVTLPIGIDFTAAKIVAEEAFLFSPSHGYTWCLPFEQPIQGFSAYTLSGCDGSTLRFKEVTGKLEAYRPYYIVLSGLLARGGSDIEVKAFDTDALTSTVGDYSFVGTVEGIGNAEAAAAGAYILQSDNLWHKVTTENADATIPPYRAYITLPASPAKALSMSLGDDGAVTGLRAIETTDHDGTVRYYDLQGRYIGTTLAGQPEGVYMGNGKKVMKK